MTRIIVADDDRVTSHLVCAILRKHGYLPEPARDVDELFAACANAPRPAAILLDLNMPGGSGTDSVRRIRSDPALTGVPLLIVSGSDQEADHQMAVASGASAFITKPIDMAQLLVAVTDAIGRSTTP